jgi:site-specific DNA recombinase
MQNNTHQLKRAIIYCRVSSREQVEEGNSLATQERICKEYALKHGFTVEKIFIEKGESAKTTDRTELKNLLTYCQQHKNQISTLIAYKLDRIARQNDGYSQIRVLLRTFGITITSATESFDDSPSGRFMERIIANVAQFDNDVRIERCVGGMKEAVGEHRYVWLAPMGYDNVRIAGKTNIHPNDRAQAVRTAFEEIARNLQPIEEIRRQVNNSLTNKAGKPISKAHFYRLLKNEIYAGWIIKFGTRTKGIFEPIVSQELFDQVQRVLKKRKRSNMQYRTEHPDSPLRRFVFDENGYKITGAWSKGTSKRYAYYRFIQGRKDYRKEFLESKFGEFLETIRIREDNYPKVKKEIQEHLANILKDETSDATRIQQTIKELKEKQNALVQKNLAGVISDNVLRAQLDLIDEELTRSYSLLSNYAQNNFNTSELLDFASEYLKNPYKIWESAPPGTKIKLQWFKCPQGIIFENGRFRTNELRSIFKVKSHFYGQKSPVVEYSSQTLNSQGQSINSKNSPDTQYSTIETEKFWQDVAGDLIALHEILKEIPNIDSESENQ